MPSVEHQRPVGVRLVDVLATTLPPTADVYATSGANQSGQVRPGDVYFAPAGDANSVLPSVEQAAEAGARAVVVDQLLPVVGTPQYVVDDTRQAFGDFCHALMGHPTRSLDAVAVAGESGKTDVARLLESIFQQAGRLPVRDNAPCRSTASVASWMAGQAADGAGCLITEAPQAAAHDRRFAGAEFRAVCLTNLEPTRTPRHSSVSAVRRDLRSAVDQLADGGVLVLNADDPDCCRLLSEWTGAAVTFGLGDTADVSAEVLERHTGGQTFLLRAGSDAAAVETPLIGDAHLSNCLAATATALALGVDLWAIVAGIESAAPLPGMMQPVVAGQDFPVYLDRAATPGAVAAAVQAAAAVAPRRVLTVLAEGANHQDITAAQSASDTVFVPGGAAPLQESNGVRVVEDRFAAVALALAFAEAGDLVLLTGCEPGSDEPLADEIITRQLLQLRINTAEEFAKAA